MRLWTIITVVLVSPILLILIGVISYSLYFKVIEPVYMELKYIANLNRTCSERADPVRVRVGDVVFRIRAEEFNVASLGQCWGSGFFGAYRGCTKLHQNQKKFDTDTPEAAVYGFCQSDRNPSFKLARMNFSFSIEDTPYKIHLGTIGVSEHNESSLTRYCRNVKEGFLMFGNPVSLGCGPNRHQEGISNCQFVALIGTNTRVVASAGFEKRELTEKDKLVFLKKIEQHIRERTIKLPSSNFEEVCKRI